MSFPKLPKKAAPLLIPLRVSFTMTAIISAISLIRATGFSSETLAHWPSAWAASWLIGFPTLLVVLPTIRKIVDKIKA